MRTSDNSKFGLYKTATDDWYNADEVDEYIAKLEAKYKGLLSIAQKANKRIAELEATHIGDVMY